MIAANLVCLVQCVVFVSVEGIFLCLHESRNAFGSWIYYEGFKKNQMHFWVWGVVVCEVFPLFPSLVHIISYFFFCPLVCFVDRFYKTNHFFFFLSRNAQLSDYSE